MGHTQKHKSEVTTVEDIESRTGSDAFITVTAMLSKHLLSLDNNVQHLQQKVKANSVPKEVSVNGSAKYTSDQVVTDSATLKEDATSLSLFLIEDFQCQHSKISKLIFR